MYSSSENDCDDLTKYDPPKSSLAGDKPETNPPKREEPKDSITKDKLKDMTRTDSREGKLRTRHDSAKKIKTARDREEGPKDDKDHNEKANEKGREDKTRNRRGGSVSFVLSDEKDKNEDKAKDDKKPNNKEEKDERKLKEEREDMEKTRGVSFTFTKEQGKALTDRGTPKGGAPRPGQLNFSGNTNHPRRSKSFTIS